MNELFSCIYRFRELTLSLEQPNIFGISLTVFIAISLIFIVNWIFSRRKKTLNGSKGDSVLLLGLCGAGKTCLFYRMLTNKFPDTVSSVEVNEKIMKITLQVECSVIDFPGHARLRNSLLSVINRAKTIIFVVDGSDRSVAMMKDLADLMYDVFSECIRNNCEPRVLVACNKSDIRGGIEPTRLRDMLEVEIDALRLSRHTIETDGDDELDVVLGTEGQKFDFVNDVGCDVKFCKMSVKDGEIEQVLNYLAIE